MGLRLSDHVGSRSVPSGALKGRVERMAFHTVPSAVSWNVGRSKGRLGPMFGTLGVPRATMATRRLGDDGDSGDSGDSATMA